eukprot:scaffold6707_cov110-Phaeocystis_antarctica.AAC.4
MLQEQPWADTVRAEELGERLLQAALEDSHRVRAARGASSGGGSGGVALAVGMYPVEQRGGGSGSTPATAPPGRCRPPCCMRRNASFDNPNWPRPAPPCTLTRGYRSSDSMRARNPRRRSRAGNARTQANSGRRRRRRRRALGCATAAARSFPPKAGEPCAAPPLASSARTPRAPPPSLAQASISERVGMPSPSARIARESDGRKLLVDEPELERSTNSTLVPCRAASRSASRRPNEQAGPPWGPWLAYSRQYRPHAVEPPKLATRTLVPARSAAANSLHAQYCGADSRSELTPLNAPPAGPNALRLSAIKAPHQVGTYVAC